MAQLFSILGIIVWSGNICRTAADYSTSTLGVLTFGSECQYMCHCKDGASCDTTTGECTQGCDTNWFGPACQYKDLAESQGSRLNSHQNPPHYSHEAHDGDTSTCSRTKEASGSADKPWWRVWFPHNETIRDIYILTEDTHLEYFRSFKVTVEYVPENKNTDNSYVPTNVQTCYQHSNTTPESRYIHVHCDQPLVGNQVRIKLSSVQSQLVLCDVRIGAGRNFAFRKSVTASGETGSFPPLNAVDGRLYSSGWIGCFAASNTSYKYLDINFGHSINAYSVSINTINNEYIKDYQIYTATTEQTTLQLVYDDTGNTPPVTYVHLNTNVQLLRIQTNNADQLVICELEIYGECPVNKCGFDCTEICYCKSYKHRISGVCTTGCQGRWTGANGKCNIECGESKWGTQCQNDCGACRVDTCNAVSGECTSGCQDGYQDTTNCITECPDGKYGERCLYSCSQYCTNTNCIKTNGVCTDGCKPGYMGDKCDQECPDGTYGVSCGKSCSINCDDVCNHVSGTCTTCKPGWKGNYCNTECPDGTYGEGCGSFCSEQCMNGNCIKTNGVCIGGCKAGYTGDRCAQERPEGTYGINCAQSCSANCEDVCDHELGTCAKCKAGWKGNYCNTECDDGKYGTGCAQDCVSRCGNACDKVNGHCSQCQPGWKGDFCETECPDGTYGINCKQSCNTNCKDVCDYVHATCTTCKAGWKGDYCNTECDDGKYGFGCAQDCIPRCGNACDKVNGHCLQCPPGWKGNVCEIECNIGQYGINCAGSCGFCKVHTSCDTVTGVCPSGCIDGYTGPSCDQVFADIEQPIQSNTIGIIAGVSVVAGIIVICVTIFAVCVVMYRRRQSPPVITEPENRVEMSHAPTSASYEDLHQDAYMNDKEETNYETINPE